jgi:glutamyl-tRNA reductase
MSADSDPNRPPPHTETSATNPASSPLTVIGVNYRTCSDAVRQQIYVADEEMAAMYAALTEAGVREAMVLSTCDRVEVAGVFSDPDQARRIVVSALAAPTGLSSEDWAESLYRHDGLDAVRHLFRVASALDSQVIGEPQVLGQVKAAHRLARQHAALGPTLERTLQAAYEAAKTVRTRTRIGEGSTSFATAALARMKDLHGSLEQRSVLLIGPGELGLIIAGHLASAGVDAIHVIDRFRRRADATAAELQTERATADGMDALGSRLAEADVVITALGEGGRLIDADLVEAVLKRRRRRPMFLLDLSVPGDVDPAVHRLDDAYVYDYDDLEYMTRETRAAREEEAAKAEALIAEAVAAFTREDAARLAGPDITRLRERIERHVHDIVLSQTAGAGVGDPEALARRIAAKLAHGPTQTLRTLAETGRLDAPTRTLIAALFGANEHPDAPTTERSEEED